MGRPRKDKDVDLGSSVINLSRFDEEYTAYEDRLKEEVDKKLREARTKKNIQKKKFDDLSLKYRETYVSVILEYAPEILAQLGINIPSTLSEIVQDKEKIAMLNEAGTFQVVFAKDRNKLSKLLRYLEDNQDFCQEISCMLDENVQ